MNKTTVYFYDMTLDVQPEDVETRCRDTYGWTPDAIREVDSGDENTRAFMCFESAADAELWDKQI